MSLEMRPVCEKCNAALPHEGEAYICSFECTFCKSCSAVLHQICPNCGGELLRRPKRKAELDWSPDPVAHRRLTRTPGKA